MKKIKKDPQRITKIKPFIDKYNWEGRNYPSEKDAWKKNEKNILTLGLNVLCAKKEKSISCLFSTYNSNRVKQVIILMIPNREG